MFSLLSFLCISISCNTFWIIWRNFTKTLDSSVFFFSLCAVSNMNSVIVRTSEVDMMITPSNIQLWNWRASFLIQSSFDELVILRNKNMHSDFHFIAVIDEALDIENWNSGCGYGIHMCSKLCVCVCVCVWVCEWVSESYIMLATLNFVMVGIFYILWGKFCIIWICMTFCWNMDRNGYNCGVI
jgi:hypothetical protein